MSKGHHVVLAGNPGHRGTMRDGDGGYRRGVSGNDEGGSLDIQPMEAAAQATQAEGKVSELFKGIGLCAISACGLGAAANWHSFLQSVSAFLR